MRTSTYVIGVIAAASLFGAGCEYSTSGLRGWDGAAGTTAIGGSVGAGGSSAIGSGGTTTFGIGGSPVGTGGTSAGTGGSVASGGRSGSGGAGSGGARGGAGGSGGGVGGGSAGSGSGGRATGGSAGSGSGGRGTGGSAGSGSGGRATGGSAGSGSGGASGRGGSTGTGGITGSGGSTGTCSASCTNLFPTCCGAGTCVFTGNDPENCGGCGVRCPAGTYCNQGCVALACSIDGGRCGSEETCCGGSCCAAGTNCCARNSPVGPARPVCFTPTTDAPRCMGNEPIVSDRNAKKNIATADVDAILLRLRDLPMSTWTYLDEPASVRHLGPMAQDFHASFGLGSDDRSYSPVDGHGVAMAAIQALDRLVRAQQARIESLERTNQELARRMRAMENRKRR